MVADQHLAVFFGGGAAVGFQFHAARGEDAQRPYLYGEQFAFFAVKREEEEHFGHAVKQAAAYAEQAEYEAYLIHVSGFFMMIRTGGRLKGFQTAFCRLFQTFGANFCR